LSPSERRTFALPILGEVTKINPSTFCSKVVTKKCVSRISSVHAAQYFFMVEQLFMLLSLAYFLSKLCLIFIGETAQSFFFIFPGILAVQ
jgi:hypothetical protein